MNKLVIDSGVTVKWFIEEDDSDTAQLIYNEYENGRISLLAPDLIYAEFGNIIWKHLIFRGLTTAEADYAIVGFQKVTISVTPINDLYNDAYQIAVKHKRTFYDSLYLALSVKENCEFVTADEKFYNSVKADFPKIVLLANWK